MKNWKSTLAFFIFVGVYIYSITSEASDGVVDSAGDIALISSLFMMFRSQVTSDIFLKLVDNIKIGK